MRRCLFQTNQIILPASELQLLMVSQTIEHIETVNLSLTESLQASSSIITQEADVISIDNTEFSNIDGFANRDFNRGSYRLESTSGDHNFFRVEIQMVMYRQI